MPIDPAAPFPMTSEGQAADRLASIERRLSALERGSPVIQVNAGAPTAVVRDGTPCGDSSNIRLWLRLNGVWRYTALT